MICKLLDGNYTNLGCKVVNKILPRAFYKFVFEVWLGNAGTAFALTMISQRLETFRYKFVFEVWLGNTRIAITLTISAQGCEPFELSSPRLGPCLSVQLVHVRLALLLETTLHEVCHGHGQNVVGKFLDWKLYERESSKLSLRLGVSCKLALAFCRSILCAAKALNSPCQVSFLDPFLYRGLYKVCFESWHWPNPVDFINCQRRSNSFLPCRHR